MIREFSNVKELITYIDGKLTEYRKVFGDVLRYVEELRRRTESQKRIQTLLAKIGVEPKISQAVAEVDLKTFKLSINPTPEAELRYYERYLEDLNQKIAKLAGIRKDLDAISTELADLGAKITVIFRDDVPEILLLKI
ncbi:MAG: hypothetical protein ACP5I7_06445 [Sulfolobales archaeon]